MYHCVLFSDGPCGQPLHYLVLNLALTKPLLITLTYSPCCWVAMEARVNGVKLPPMELVCDKNTCQTSSALTADIEDFDAIVSVTESLNQLAAHVADERFQSNIFLLERPNTELNEAQEGEKENAELDLSSVISLIRTHSAPTTTPVLPVVERKSQCSPGSTGPSASALPPGATASVSSHPFSTLLPGALSAVLRATLPPHRTSDPKPRKEGAVQGPVSLEQLRTELLDLRDEVEMMKSQHNKEIQQLMNELDEEKRIRLSLQMEIAQMKKQMSKSQKHLSK
ncbi:SH3 domain-containing kinase-binding protein 1 isoform X2 [Esox lucius]|uniref:SH3 domain-containing kinase-binding protein 1 isoform X2 n=1 Tax=Esox lucius TaxID=8010 RepID=UPI0009734B21|nr:SH3 domain-containing kinase-binding protein 1 isoform X2 [Esox lucius]